jgi:hypothetical protein
LLLWIFLALNPGTSLSSHLIIASFLTTP